MSKATEKVTIPHGTPIRFSAFVPVTKERRDDSIERGQCAINMCGGLLGDCYVLEEIIENRAMDAIAEFSHRPWWRTGVKHSFRKSLEILRRNMEFSRKNSNSSVDFMCEMSDRMSDGLKDELDCIEKTMAAGFSSMGTDEPDLLARMHVVGTLMDMCGHIYDGIIAQCCETLGTYDFYDSWYKNCSCRDCMMWWDKGMEEFRKTRIRQTIDLDSMPGVREAVVNFREKLTGSELSDRLQEEVRAEIDPGKGDEIYEASLKKLGVRQDENDTADA